MATRLFIWLVVVFLTCGARAAVPAYDEAADAKEQIRQALTVAQSTQLPVLVIFGANWCGDCRALDASLHTTKNAELISKAFVVTKVDVGNFNRNLDVAERYGNPIKKGIPAAIILSPDNRVLYTTAAGELANARRMSDSGIYDFFANAVTAARSAK